MIKKVVRRYIFERLQATVTSNEGDLDSLKQTIVGLQDDVKNKARDVEHVAMQQVSITMVTILCGRSTIQIPHKENELF